VKQGFVASQSSFFQELQNKQALRSAREGEVKKGDASQRSLLELQSPLATATSATTTTTNRAFTFTKTIDTDAKTNAITKGNAILSSLQPMQDKADQAANTRTTTTTNPATTTRTATTLSFITTTTTTTATASTTATAHTTSTATMYEGVANARSKVAKLLRDLQEAEKD
jgi:hypothetical protein